MQFVCSYCLEQWESQCSHHVFVFFQAEDGIRDLVRSRGLGDVYKRQVCGGGAGRQLQLLDRPKTGAQGVRLGKFAAVQSLSLIHI